ncbi:MAG: hypothetical protein SH817_08715 [Leptospira sp.]|nr:hypothetical protein [Leptospira sp.]
MKLIQFFTSLLLLLFLGCYTVKESKREPIPLPEAEKVLLSTNENLIKEEEKKIKVYRSGDNIVFEIVIEEVSKKMISKKYFGKEKVEYETESTWSRVMDEPPRANGWERLFVYTGLATWGATAIPVWLLELPTLPFRLTPDIIEKPIEQIETKEISRVKLKVKDPYIINTRCFALITHLGKTTIPASGFVNSLGIKTTQRVAFVEGENGEALSEEEEIDFSSILTKKEKDIISERQNNPEIPRLVYDSLSSGDDMDTIISWLGEGESILENIGSGFDIISYRYRNRDKSTVQLIFMNGELKTKQWFSN